VASRAEVALVDVTSTSSPSPVDVLDAFYGEHRLCGDLDGGVDEGGDGQAYGWFDCTHL
jgi:hypothetical protein